MGISLPVLLGLQAIQGLASGADQSQLAGQAQKESYTLGKRGMADQEALAANQLARQSQLSPLRDQAIYQLSGMLGVSPHAFNPTSYLTPTNSGPQGIGGVDLNGLAARSAAYQPGMGGVTSNVPQMILNRLGYGNTGTGTLFDNPTTRPDHLTGMPGAAQTMGGVTAGGGGALGAAPTAAPFTNPTLGAALGGTQRTMFPPSGGMAGAPPGYGLQGQPPAVGLAERLRQLNGLGGY